MTAHSTLRYVPVLAAFGLLALGSAKPVDEKAPPASSGTTNAATVAPADAPPKAGAPLGRCMLDDQSECTEFFDYTLDEETETKVCKLGGGTWTKGAGCPSNPSLYGTCTRTDTFGQKEVKNRNYLYKRNGVTPHLAKASCEADTNGAVWADAPAHVPAAAAKASAPPAKTGAPPVKTPPVPKKK